MATSRFAASKSCTGACQVLRLLKPAQSDCPNCRAAVAGTEATVFLLMLAKAVQLRTGSPCAKIAGIQKFWMRLD